MAKNKYIKISFSRNFSDSLINSARILENSIFFEIFGNSKQLKTIFNYAKITIKIISKRKNLLIDSSAFQIVYFERERKKNKFPLEENETHCFLKLLNLLNRLKNKIRFLFIIYKFVFHFESTS